MYLFIQNHESKSKVMSMLLILLLSVASAFLDPLEGDVRAVYSTLAGGPLGPKIRIWSMSFGELFFSYHLNDGIETRYIPNLRVM